MSLLVGSERAVSTRERRPLWAASKAIWFASVVLPLPGGPTIMTREPRGKPPPSTRSRSGTPDGSTADGTTTVPPSEAPGRELLTAFLPPRHYGWAGASRPRHRATAGMRVHLSIARRREWHQRRCGPGRIREPHPPPLSVRGEGRSGAPAVVGKRRASAARVCAGSPQRLRRKPDQAGFSWKK